MRKIVYLIIFLPLITNAQKWSVGLMVSPDKSSTSTAKVDNDWKNFPLGYEVGFTAYRKLSNSFYFNTGLTIGKRKSNIIYPHSYYGNPNVVVYTYSNFTDLNIPLLFNYRFNLSKKLYLTSSTGVILGWYLKSKYRVKYNDPDELQPIDNTGIRKFDKKIDELFFSLGIGAGYKINDKFSLMVMPNAMITIINGDRIKSLNLRCSLLYSL